MVAEYERVYKRRPRGRAARPEADHRGMTTTSPAEQAAPVTMEEAVGYPAIACTHETLAEHTVVLKHDGCSCW